MVKARHGILAAGLGLAGSAGLLLTGCSSPFEPLGGAEMRQSIQETTERELLDAQAQPDMLEMPAPSQEVIGTFTPERLEELQQISGRRAYDNATLDLGPDLLGQESEKVGLSLRQALLSTIERNLDLQAANLAPAIREADVVAAEAVFDATFFANLGLTWLDEPQITTGTAGVGVIRARSNVSNIRTLETGIRKNLVSGGQFGVSTTMERTDNSTSGFVFSPDPGYSTNVLLSLSQPLLRNFGSDVALAEVRVSRNQQRQEVEQLRSQMISLINEVERTYWQLLQARWNLLIRNRLLERGIETREQLRGRLGFDVTPAEWSDAVARVEDRKAEIISAKALVRQVSDALKLLINHPDMPVGSEVLIVPLDEMITEPIDYSLLDAVTNGLGHRPEVQQSILNMDNAAIQVTVTNNARLPILDLAASMQFSGLDDSVDDSYDVLTDGSFINYLVQLQFEYPLGNRAAEARYRQSRLQQNQAVLAYRNVVRQVVLDVKTAVRDLKTNYELLGQRDSARLAAAENLRTLTVQEEVQALTPEFLNLKFQRQDQLAAAELRQIQALVEYNLALANLYAAMGLALEHNQIDFVVPELADSPE